MTALLYRWTEPSCPSCGTCLPPAMEPTPYYRRLATQQYKLGTAYRLGEIEGRSGNSHKQFFAAINDAWANLPEQMSDQFPSPDHLRKWALSHTEFCEQREYRARSRAEAMRVAQHLKADEFVRVQLDGLIVREFRPRSQSYGAMSNREFQRSKQAVFVVLAQLLGIDVDDLKENAGRAA